jgi:hypothetical protein
MKKIIGLSLAFCAFSSVASELSQAKSSHILITCLPMSKRLLQPVATRYFQMMERTPLIEPSSPSALAPPKE